VIFSKIDILNSIQGAVAMDYTPSLASYLNVSENEIESNVNLQGQDYFAFWNWRFSRVCNRNGIKMVSIFCI
jgi:hypothetical protein